jgi:hypothetical protein
MGTIKDLEYYLILNYIFTDIQPVIFLLFKNAGHNSNYNPFLLFFQLLTDVAFSTS